MSTQPRILYFSSLFPSPCEPYRGSFSLRRVQALIRAGADVQVVCPVGLTPPIRLSLEPGSAVRWVGRQLSIPSRSTVEGVPVSYPKWVWPPKALIGGLEGHLLYRQVTGKLDRLIGTFRPDAIVASWLPDAAAACLVGRRHGIPVVAIAEGSDLLYLPRMYRWWPQMRSALNTAQAVVFVSEHLRSRAPAAGLHGHAEFVVHNGFDETLFVPPEERKEGNEAVVLTVGWHTEVKDQATLLKAAAIATPRIGRPLRVVLVGEGPLKPRLRELAGDLGLTAVDFLGQRSQAELVPLYQAADVFCLPSRSEGMGCVLLEAMGCGTPVVASRVGGIPEVVPEESGILVPASDSPALAVALKAALERSWDHDTIRRRALDRFTWEQTAAGLLGVVADVLAQPHPTSVRSREVLV